LATRSPHKPIREQPSYIKGGELRDFQITGLNFLAYNWCKGNNVILADEMGLGKTVQTVSFLNWLRHDRQQEGPFLVVVPLSTLPAWTDTFMTWTPDVNFVVYTGNESARKIIREYELCEDGNWKQTKFTVLLTTYEYILQDARELSQIKWQFMAVDEAHRLKNRESQLYAKLRDMKAPSRLLITGTPMQNTLGELAALMDFLMPGTVKIDEDINLQSQEAGKVIAELTNAIKPYILRRTKIKVENDLPPKCEKIIRVELADVQRTHYKNIITRNYAALNQGTKGHKQSLLNIVMELRKASNHPFMFENVKERILGGTDRRDEILKGIITSSGKMMLLDRLLTKLKKDNHRVLIFSQMVKMLDILSEYLQLRGYQYQRLDGTIPAGPRRMAIDHFNAPESNDFCFLLSTRAGGLGINLMTADTVILFDADWNPHADLQAMARAHRIGQKKAVNVYRFVAKDSIEEDVLLRARNKLLLEFITIQRGVTDESSKQYSDLLAKAGTHVNEPTSPDDISRLLRHRSQKMFEESSTQKKLEDLDIDAVLEDAEEHKIEGPTGLEADGGEEFLRSFNYLDVKLDPEWDDIIPQDQLVELKAEAKKQADEVYLDEVIQANAPRKRKAPGGGPERQERQERQERAVKRAREMAASEEAANASEDDPSRPLGEKELRNLFRAFLRYGSLEERMDEVLRDAHLVGRDLGLLRAAIAEITAKSRDLLEEERVRVQELERASQKALTKKDRRAVLFDYKGVKRLNAETILSRPGEMRLLKRVIESAPDALNFRVPEASKAAHYSCAWSAREDSMLLVGILKHGYGAWTAIRDDPSLGMADKLFLEEQRVDKKEERTKGADKAAKSPGAVHLVRRADYLLSLLQEREGRAKAAPRAPLTPEQSGGASGGLKRKSGADSDMSRAKRPRLPAADAGRALGEALADPHDAILQKLFRPVRQSLKSVKAATKDGVPCKTERAKILRRELLGIGAHIATLLEGCKGQVDTLEKSLW
jgi:chromodomain-helicase-DNA-binding protein 1